jgi:hypothetical protein
MLARASTRQPAYSIPETSTAPTTAHACTTAASSVHACGAGVAGVGGGGATAAKRKAVIGERKDEPVRGIDALIFDDAGSLPALDHYVVLQGGALEVLA